MTLLERINKSTHNTSCGGCKYFIQPRMDLFFCKKKDKIILKDYPPTKCDLYEKTEHTEYLPF